jgi:hypothetical protein
MGSIVHRYSDTVRYYNVGAPCKRTSCAAYRLLISYNESVRLLVKHDTELILWIDETEVRKRAKL